MSAEALLSKLRGVRATGTNRWIACCPGHEDRNPSLSITVTSTGVTLLNCFAQCGAADVLAAVGLDFADLYPPKSWEPGKPPRRERSTFDAAAVLKIITADALDVAVIASDIAQGKPLTDSMRQRLWGAAGRISNGLEATNATR